MDPAPPKTVEVPYPALGEGPPVSANKYAWPREMLDFFPLLKDDRLHPTAWEFPAYLDNPAVPWLRTLKELYASPLAFPASLSPQAGLFLHALVLNLRPRVVVEVGTFIGVSTIWMGAALAETAGGEPPVAEKATRALIHSFDNFGPIEKGPWRDAELPEGRVEAVRRNLAAAGVSEGVVLYRGNSSAEIRKAQEALRRAGGVDFALLDGDHTPRGVAHDLWALEPVLNTGGFVLLHDTIPEQTGNALGPRYVLDYANQIGTALYERCELYSAPLNYGMALLRRVG